MVEEQIESRGISDVRLLDALRKVPRHEFVPAELRHEAYTDGPLPIGMAQTISQPYIVAKMTELLELRSTDRVLEVGTGSGYQSAILSRLAGEVFTVEIVPALAVRSAQILRRLNCRNVHLRRGDGFDGWAEHAPFDAIIVTCCPERVPHPLLDQLKEGGRMVIPIGSPGGQQLEFLTKKKGELQTAHIFAVAFVPMTGRAASGRSAGE
jgi:protein-L-isoaspartate(D-aspartate) O-methyltransferase